MLLEYSKKSELNCKSQHMDIGHFFNGDKNNYFQSTFYHRLKPDQIQLIILTFASSFPCEVIYSVPFTCSKDKEPLINCHNIVFTPFDFNAGSNMCT